MTKKKTTPENLPMCSPALRDALKATIFPWMRHLSLDQQNQFLAELARMLCGTSKKHLDESIERAFRALVRDLRRVICSWESTALTCANSKLTRELKRPLSGCIRRNSQP